MKSDLELGLSGSEFQAVLIVFWSVGQMLETDSTNDEFCIVFKVCCRRHYLPCLRTEAGTRGVLSCSLYFDDSFQAGVKSASQMMNVVDFLLSADLLAWSGVLYNQIRGCPSTFHYTFITLGI